MQPNIFKLKRNYKNQKEHKQRYNMKDDEQGKLKIEYLQIVDGK